MEPNYPGLEITENPKFIRNDWRFERIGWVLMLLFVLAALAGLFGRGGLIWNEATAGSPSAGLEVKYSQFWRQEAPEELILTVSGPDSVIEIHTKTLHLIKIDNLLPQPEQAEYSADKVKLLYKPGNDKRNIQVHLTPLKAGRFNATFKTGSGRPVDFSVLIYP